MFLFYTNIIYASEYKETHNIQNESQYYMAWLNTIVQYKMLNECPV